MTATTPASNSAPLTILVAGASGLIGTELVTQLRADGYEVRTLVRREATAPGEFTWSPRAGTIAPGALDSVDAVISLSGASLGRIPWTRDYRAAILESRVLTTSTLATAIARSTQPPSVFLSASAVGIYGDRPGELLTEESTRGRGFLADVVEQWESAAQIAAAATRVVTFRTGFVIGDGGGMKPLLLLTKFGLGSRIASGAQNLPWISLHDEAAAIRHLLTSEIEGAVNLVGPVPSTFEMMTRALARRLRRPHLFVLPRFVISTVMGEAGRQLLLVSQRAVPQRLTDDGFVFRHQTVAAAIDALVSKR
ncbi:TIGR01777 family oxidoreductase [Marisediminicola sp. LYQ85]|uniref:TIGR01777 family oxidoreductase n=1 Tax=Marisediminicola sp. LYQ85 TaxID=3391062 RepID=UPI0039837E01